MNSSVTRRDFLQISGLSMAGTAVAGALTPARASAATRHPRSDSPSATRVTTDATYYNNALTEGADPHVRYDVPSGYYYAYSTVGGGTDAAGRSYHFGIYRSADLATWEHIPGGALPVDDPKAWGKDWFWAPETYYNPKTGIYFFFYSARENSYWAKKDFGYADFEEPCRIGVAVSRSPEGPFYNVSDRPIDYHPYDPDYHDVNLIMGPEQMKPPETLEEGRTAPLGVYIPTIDANLYFEDGRIHLYYSRNAYRNWVWDPWLEKYIETSNILAVELTTDWWHDPEGATMPTCTDTYRGATASPGGPDGPRRDGWVQILSYIDDPQEWENSHVNDYEQSGGTKKNRRWEEGSTTIKRHVGTDEHGRARPLYYLTYSANNWQSPDYGVGYATATSPLGPWQKFEGNPILSKDASLPMYSTGHGSIVTSSDGTEMYYPHHGRPTPTTRPRRLYTERLYLNDTSPDENGNPTLVVDQTTSDRPVPSGVAPYAITASQTAATGDATHVRWQVTSASGAQLALGNPLNRVSASLDRPGTITPDEDGFGATVTLGGKGAARLALTYQRQQASGNYEDTSNIFEAPSGKQRRAPVSMTITLAQRHSP